MNDLTLEFKPDGPTPDGSVPVVLHKNHQGGYEIESPLVKGDSYTITTKSFSPRVFGFIDIGHIADKVLAFVGQRLASGIAGRTDPLTCSGAPAWLDYGRGYSPLVHVCATSASNSRGEIQIKSNRGVSLQLKLPPGASYVWVENQPWEMRTILGDVLGFDPNRTVVLPAGARMTVGFVRPQKSEDFVLTVSPTGAMAYIDTWAGILIDYIIGSIGKNDARILIAEAFRQCDVGQGSNLSSVFSSPDPGSLVDFGKCFTKQVIATFEDEESAIRAVQRFGGDRASATELAKRGKGGQCFRFHRKLGHCRTSGQRRHRSRLARCCRHGRGQQQDSGHVDWRGLVDAPTDNRSVFLEHWKADPGHDPD